MGRLVDIDGLCSQPQVPMNSYKISIIRFCVLGGGTYGDFLVQRGARLKVVLHNLPTEMTEPRLTQLLGGRGVGAYVQFSLLV